MKTVVSLALLGLAQANVHKFYAEHNFICNMCEQSLGLVLGEHPEEAQKLCQDPTGGRFSKICDAIVAKGDLLRGFMEKEGLSAYQICEKLQYCSEWTDPEFSGKLPFSYEVMEAINTDESIPWKAGINDWIYGMDMAQVRRKLGTVVDPEHTFKLPPKTYSRYGALPTNFDARTQWANCAAVIGHVRDQSACGSCWAFGSTEAWNDRLCIAQNGAFQQLLSPEDTMSCCTGFSCGFSEGCNGGQPTAAWSWFTLEGVVSGGDYDDKGKTDTCEPYQFPPCAHHENSSQYPPCPSTEYHTPPCKKSCTNTGYAKTWDSDEHVAKKAYSLRSINDIMTDIYTYGTVTAAFTVYEDFLYYTSGVYVHTWGQEVGGHAIKIIGWGVENNVDYWLCVNSWNDTWGDQGLFKIKKGVNECGIESDVSAGTAN